MMKSVFGSLAPVFVFLCLAFSAAFAQDLDTVTFSGQVVDSNNAPIVGATVTATLVETGIERSLVTNEDGRFRIVQLRPGTYNVRAEAPGFGAKANNGLVTISGQSLLLNFTLAPADITVEQTVTINEDSTPVIDITRTVVGGTLTEREIEDLPNDTRNPYDLVLTLGGVTEEALSTRDLSDDRNVTNATAPAEQGNFSLSGGVSYSNNITIDGFDNNDDRSADLRFQPSLETIAEVQVITNQFSAEYGRASGGRINLVTRAGSNRLRGRVFMFFRDDNLNANTWYNNSRGFARLPLTEYNPGFTLRGPIVIPKLYDGRRRTFFAVGYEYLNVQDTTFINTYVPLVSNPRFPLPAGNSPCPVAVCRDNNSSPAVDLGAFTSLFPTPNVNHVVTARIDHKLNKRNDFTVGYQFGRRKNQRTTAAAVTRLDDAIQARIIDTDAINFTDNHIFSSRFLNNFKFQYSILERGFQTDNPFDPVILISYQNPETGGSQTLIVGNSTASGGNSETFPQARRETRYQFQDTLTYLIGKHSLKFGGDLHTIRSKATELSDATGTFNFANMGNFQQNVLSRFRQNFGTGSDVKNTYWAAFINDEIKLRQNLTLNLGLRYERETSVDDTDNFGPRFGVAWSPFKSRRGVVRFGGGIFYNRTLLRTIADFIQNVNGLTPFDTNSIGTGATDPRRIAILSAIAQRFPGAYQSESEIRSLVTSACASIVTTLPCNANTGFILNQGSTGNPLRSVDPTLKIPESYQFNVGFEREFIKGWVFEANYTWNRTIRLWRDRNINVPILPAGFSDWTQYLLANPFQLSPTRQYTFYLGSTNDSSGITTTPNGTTNCTTTTANCFVNLNSVNTATTAPLVAVTGTNNNATGAPIGIARAAIAQFRPNQNFQEQSRIGSVGRAFYQGLVLEIRSRYRRYGNGFGGNFRVNYTLSSVKDDGLNNTSNAQINGLFEDEFTRTIQDRRHRVNFSGSFDTPYWLGKLRFSPRFRYGSSAPFSLGTGSDRNLDDVSTDRPNFSGNINDIVWRRPGSSFPEALAAQFSLPPIGARGGNLPRNAGRGPELYIFDLSVSREWRFKERFRLRPNIEIGNVFNMVVFNYGAAFINYVAPGNNPTATQLTNRNNFLIPTRTYRPRQIRLGVRFDF